MSIMAKLYKTNGEIIEVSPKNGSDYTLSELQDFVQGGLIEIILLDTEEMMIVNEEGKLNNLPFNENATKLWKQHFGETNFIVGNALVCKQDEVL